MNFPVVASRFDLLCPADTDLKLIGNGLAPGHQSLLAKFKRCKGKDYCKSDYEIDYVVTRSFISMTFNDGYFDYNTVDKPIKFFYENIGVIPLVYSMYKTVDVFLTKNNYKIHDDYLVSSNHIEGSFYSLEGIEKDAWLYEFPGSIEGKNPVFATIIIKMSSKLEYHESRVYSIFDVIGQLGGSFEIFELLGKLCIGYYVNKLFYHYVVNCLHKQNDFIINRSREYVEGSEIAKEDIPSPMIKIGKLDLREETKEVQNNKENQLNIKKSKIAPLRDNSNNFSDISGNFERANRINTQGFK